MNFDSDGRSYASLTPDSSSGSSAPCFGDFSNESLYQTLYPPPIGSNLQRKSSCDQSSSGGFYRSRIGIEYPIIQINGCRKYGPPPNWIGPEPPISCELFIKDIPRNKFENDIIPPFERFGCIYSFRLMMEFGQLNRGYAYLRYSTEAEAQCAIDVMRYFLVETGKTLDVQKSYNKCRLFVGNIPREKSYNEVYYTLKELFPKMCKLIFQCCEKQNRGFAFIDFPDHETALEAKMMSSPGYIRIWDRDIKIVWANPERNCDADVNYEDSTTLFIRNIGLDVTTAEIKSFIESAVDRSNVKQLTTVRDFAFVEFLSRDAAKKAKEKLQGRPVKSLPVDIEWARPPAENSVHQLKNTDFDAELRIRCIANYWDVPIILYGRVFEQLKVQCVSVIIKREIGIHVYLIEINFSCLNDIQSRVCEIVINLINAFGHLPTHNLVIKAEKDKFTVVGYMKYLEAPYFIPSRNAHGDSTLFFDEIYDLALLSQIISSIPSEKLYNDYEQKLKTQRPFAYLDYIAYNGRVVGCFNGKLRNKPPLKHRLDNRQILLVLCCAFTRTNFNFYSKPILAYPLKFFYPNGTVFNEGYLKTISLLPVHFVQSKRFGTSIEQVLFGHYPLALPYLDPVAHLKQHNSLTKMPPQPHLMPIGLHQTYSA